MKRAVVLIALVAVALAGCGQSGMSAEQMREIAEARDTCIELGGEFRQWTGVYGEERWDCDFQEETNE